MAGSRGSSQVHPNVVRNMGLDPETLHWLCLWHGPDRLTMLRYGVNDLRLFFDGDIRFLSQFQLTQKSELLPLATQGFQDCFD